MKLYKLVFWYVEPSGFSNEILVGIFDTKDKCFEVMNSWAVRKGEMCVAGIQGCSGWEFQEIELNEVLKLAKHDLDKCGLEPIGIF